jgi:hypothetical protein
MGLTNSEYIDDKLFDTEIDEILKDTVPDHNDISIVWIDDKYVYHSHSFNNLYKTSCSNNRSMKEYLDIYDYVGRTMDNKYEIYLFLLPDNIEANTNGIHYKNDEVQLPQFKHFKYQNLYTYKNEEQFINAIIIEFIVRNARHNNLFNDFSTIDEALLDSETDEEYEYRVMKLLHEKEEKVDKILLQLYGLNTYELSKLDLTIYKYGDQDNLENLSIQVNTTEPYKDKVIDLSLPKDKLIEQTVDLQNNYEKSKKEFFPLKQKINKNFLKESEKIINKFPKSFKKKKDHLIKSLFIFDYIEATKKNVDDLNIPIYKNYENSKIELRNEYKIKLNKKNSEIQDQKDYPKIVKEIEKEIREIENMGKKELLKIEQEQNENLCSYPKMDTKYKNCIYYELAPLLDEKPGQCKKLYNHIHKFITINFS